MINITYIHNVCNIFCSFIKYISTLSRTQEQMDIICNLASLKWLTKEDSVHHRSRLYFQLVPIQVSWRNALTFNKTQIDTLLKMKITEMHDNSPTFFQGTNMFKRREDIDIRHIEECFVTRNLHLRATKILGQWWIQSVRLFSSLWDQVRHCL